MSNRIDDGRASGIAQRFGDYALADRLRDGMVSPYDLSAATAIYNQAAQQMNYNPQAYGAREQLSAAQLLYSAVAGQMNRQTQWETNAEYRKDWSEGAGQAPMPNQAQWGQPSNPPQWGQADDQRWQASPPPVQHRHRHTSNPPVRQPPTRSQLNHDAKVITQTAVQVALAGWVLQQLTK